MKEKQLIPPRKFKPAGVVEWVQFSPTPPPFINDKQKRYGRRAEGIRYEKKAQAYMEEKYEGFYVASPWFRFKEAGVDRPRWCQPDGLLILPHTGQLTIIEYKLQHTPDAWWQLKWLYHPVIAKAFSPANWDISLCEVVKWYDPATTFPEKVKMKPSIIQARPNEFGVHICKP